MERPIILAVDDEAQVLNTLERDLRQQYGKTYRILKAGSAAEALNAVQRLKQRGSSLALFICDQRMPGQSGTEFLMDAIQYFPEAKKVLLTAYADTEAAITSINRIGLDHYLLKPWDPPETNLYPILDDLLQDWSQSVSLPYAGIRVAGALWSAASHNVKNFLARNQIPYQWLDIEKDDQARLLVESVSAGQHNLPVVFFPDDSVLIAPDLRLLAEKTGLHTRATQPFYDLVIIGAGPAGLAAAVYGASEGLHTLVIEKEATGGQAGTSSRIENYLGFPNGLTGADLTRRAVSQARKFGAEILTAAEAAGVRAESSLRLVQLASGETLGCHALLVATGVTVKRLEAPGVERLTGSGVYYGAALTEAANYRDLDVHVLGGANSAGQAAMHFARYAARVTLIVRASHLEVGMSQYLVNQIRATPNIDVLPNHEIIAVDGSDRLQTIEVLCRADMRRQTLSSAALFLFIGAQPHTDLVGPLVERDSTGFILTGPDLLRNGKRPHGWTLPRDPFLLETSCPGIFAAGDVRHGSIKRVGSAVGEGAVSIALVHQYLRTV